MTIIVAGTVDIDPARLDAALEAAAPLIAGALAEKGCLDYDWSPDPRNPGRLRIFERWDEEANLAAHLRSRWYLDMRDAIASFGIRGGAVMKYRVDREEPVYDETGTPRADFFTGNEG